MRYINLFQLFQLYLYLIQIYEVLVASSATVISLLLGIECWFTCNILPLSFAIYYLPVFNSFAIYYLYLLQYITFLCCNILLSSFTIYYLFIFPANFFQSPSIYNFSLWNALGLKKITCNILLSFCSFCSTAIHILPSPFQGKPLFNSRNPSFPDRSFLNRGKLKHFL